MKQWRPLYFFLYSLFLLDMDLRICIWNISTTNYKCTSFKPVGFTVQTMEFMFMKWVNEESGAEMAVYLYL